MLFELEKEQQLAFNRLKKAYKDCAKLGVVLINQYGTLHAYSKKMITDMGDEIIKPMGHPVSYYELDRLYHNYNTINNIDVGRADDSDWILGLTDKGFKIYNKEVDFE